MRIVVLGAGVVGVTAAWYLAADGHEVTVVDRQPAPAMETSFANGGQISVSHAEPWANPSAPLKILKWLGREDSPLLWRLRADWAQWRWGLQFLAQCTRVRTEANIGAIVRLGLSSRAQLQALRRELSLEYDQVERGILHFYTDRSEFEQALPQVEVMQRHGCRRVARTAEQCLVIEPALAQSNIPVVGGTYTVEDESGDARRFTEALVQHCLIKGVSFVFEAPIRALDRVSDRISSLRLTDGRQLTADAFVVATGSYSAALLAPLGIRIPVYPAKGYSATFPLPPGVLAPQVSLTDDGHKLVFSRMGNRLRVAGTAEFSGFDLSLNPARCEALARRTRALFPQLGTLDDVEYWTGLRPATPNNVPLIGRTGLSNLWLNTGHGTLGWTLACGSGRLLADLVAGRPSDVDPTSYQAM